MNREWFKNVKKFLHPSLSTNMVFSFILFGLEKLVEMDFECPCTTKTTNSMFSAAFICIPVVIVTPLMVLVNGKVCNNKIFSCFIPGLVWLALLFFDGRYVACAATDWGGSYVADHRNNGKPWCHPANESEAEVYALLTRVRWFRTASQIAGLCILSALGLLLFPLFWSIRVRGSEDPSVPQNEELEEMRPRGNDA